MSDQNWAGLAHASRDALGLLGYGITPRCLPDEPEACGGTFAEHVAAHLAALKAVADHHLTHLGAPAGMLADVYEHTTADLEHDGGPR
ncbi:MAG: hypothetical protein ACRDPY_28390 [Streptosporangiaceae bacterium]